MIQQGRGTWQLRVSAGSDPVSGKRKRIIRSFKGTKREAALALARLVLEVESGIDTDPGRLTVFSHFERWLEYRRTRVRPETWARYENLIRIHVVPELEALKLSRVRPAHVQRVLDRMASGGGAAASVTQCYRVVSGALRQAVRWQYLATNPAEAVSPPRRERPALQVPAMEALQRLLEATQGSSWEAPLTIAVATGLRRGEVLGIHWYDVDLDAGKVRVTATVQRHTGKGLVIVDPKTDRARRQVKLPTPARDALRRYRADQVGRRLKSGEAWEDRELLFDRGDGHPLDPDVFSRAFKRYAKKAGLPAGTRLHDLRHAFATTLLAEGEHPAVTSAVLGHSSPAFTMSVYQHVLDSMGEQAAQSWLRAWRTAKGQSSKPS
ncbi:MAG TPA: tyrosine-type recombinase/integrase [Actinomycetota bacterium]|nr:tyrosine-type recombinase/integrase [Actinomycetota bacterium]